MNIFNGGSLNCACVSILLSIRLITESQSDLFVIPLLFSCFITRLGLICGCWVKYMSPNLFVLPFYLLYFGLLKKKN